MCAGNFGYGGNRAIRGNAGSLHEERDGIFVGLLDYIPGDVWGPAGNPGADFAGEGHGRCADGPCWEQMRPRVGPGGRPGAGAVPSPVLGKLHVYGNVGQGQNQRFRSVYGPCAPN